MVHGRVVGQELRDVPPERFPIWGQRWFARCRARRASEFETRTFQFTAHGIVQVGPVLSSPSQFYSTIGDDGQENEGSPPNPAGPALSPSPPVQTYATELTSSSSSTSQVAPHLLLHRYHSDPMPSMSQGPPFALHPHPVDRLPRRQNTVGPPGAVLALHADSEFRPLTHGRVHQTQHSFVPLDYDESYWHTNPPSTGTQPRAGSSRESHIASGHPQEFLLPGATHGQFSAGPSRSSTQVPQLDSSLHSGYHLHPHNRTGIYLTPPPPSSLNFTVPLPHQNANSSWRTTEPSVPVIPNTLPFQDATVAQWQSGSGSVNSVPLSGAGSSSYLNEEFTRLFTDSNGNPSPLEMSLDIFAEPPADESILLLDTIHGDGYSR